MIHPTARRLDEPPTFFWFTFPQWLALLAGTGVLYLGHAELHLKFRPLFAVWVFLVMLPVALTSIAENGSVAPGRILLDLVGMLRAPRIYEAGPGESKAGFLLLSDADAPRQTAPQPVEVNIPWQ